MSLTAEQRAKAVLDQYEGSQRGLGKVTGMLRAHGGLQAILAATIKQAENDVLEKAAALADAGREAIRAEVPSSDPDQEIVGKALDFTAELIDGLAIDIRALKQ